MTQQEQTSFDERKKIALKELSNYTPDKIYDNLDKYVIGCEAAKKTLSVFGFRQRRKMSGYHYSHSPSTTVLLQGGTGCGKTYLVEKLADYLKLPFIHVDCSSLTSEGYIGNSIRDMLLPLNNMPNGGHAIVFLDEFDKLGTNFDASNGGAGITTTKVQMELLRTIEGKQLDPDKRGSGGVSNYQLDAEIIENALKAYKLERHDYEGLFTNKINNLMETSMTLALAQPINTANILFIFGGRFEGVDLTNKEDAKTLGFGANESSAMCSEKRAHFAKKLVDFGMLPELVGRISQILHVPDMTEETLSKILEVKGGALDRFQRMFKEENVLIELTPSAKQYVVETALSFKLGARPLLSILDGLFTQIEYTVGQNLDRDLPMLLMIDKAHVEKLINQL